MDQRTIATGEASGLLLACGRRRFPILTLDAEGCLIEAEDCAGIRGYADIVDDARLVATCLIVLAAPDAPEGHLVRCTFKRRTMPRSTPPADYVDGTFPDDPAPMVEAGAL